MSMTDLSSLIVASLERAVSLPDAREPYTNRMSAAGHCPRQRAYHAAGVAPSDVPGAAISVRERGRVVEEVYIARLTAAGWRITDRQAEVRIPAVEGVGDIVGHLDGVIHDDDGAAHPFDIKSVVRAALPRLRREGARPAHVAQLRLYMLARGYTKGLLVYVATESCLFGDEPGDVLIVEVLPDRDHEARLIETYAEIAAHAKGGPLPARAYGSPEKECDYCPWASTCWDGLKAEAKSHAKDADLSDLAAAATAYREAKTREDAAASEASDLRDRLLASLAERGVASGRAGAYRLARTIATRKSLDAAAVRAAHPGEFEKTTEYPTLRVTDAKEDA